MPNIIRLPLKGSGANDNQPRYTSVSVDNVVSLEKSGSNDRTIHVFYNSPGSATDNILRLSIDYSWINVASIVSDQDIKNLERTIKSANQKPGSAPIFELFGAINDSSNVTQYQVSGIDLKSEAAPTNL